MKKRRNYAVLIFMLALVFCGAEVFAVCIAKNHHDYVRAKADAEELSIELGLISSAFSSGNRTLYDNAVSRFRSTLSAFSGNEYVYHQKSDLLTKLRDYNDLLNTNEGEITELIELSTALATVRTELRNSHAETLDAQNFYRIQDSLASLTATLENIKAENLSQAKAKLATFADDVTSLIKTSVVCISACSKESFEAKQKNLDEIKERYTEEFKNIGEEASKKYEPSSIIIALKDI